MMQDTDWDVITNPISGERLRFLGRDGDAVRMEVTLPAGGLPVIEHRHPGWERFEVQDGVLDLRVEGVLHRLRAGQQHTVTTEFHFPANTGDTDAVVIVTASLGDFAERGLRGAFGLARDGRMDAKGRPKDLLAFALLSERGAYQIAGPPRAVWVALMTVLGWIAVLAGKRRVLERYWPPDLERPWRRRRSRA